MLGAKECFLVRNWVYGYLVPSASREEVYGSLCEIRAWVTIIEIWGWFRFFVLVAIFIFGRPNWFGLWRPENGCSEVQFKGGIKVHNVQSTSHKAANCTEYSALLIVHCMEYNTINWFLYRVWSTEYGVDIAWTVCRSMESVISAEGQADSTNRAGTEYYIPLPISDYHLGYITRRLVCILSKIG